MAARPIYEANRELLPGRKMQRDIPAIIDVSAIELRRVQHRPENLLRHRAGDRRHRGNEEFGSKWRDRGMHAARNYTSQQALLRAGRLTQFRQLFAELVQQTCETSGRRFIRYAPIGLRSAGLHDQVDRTVLQMEPGAIGEQGYLRKPP